VAVQFFAFLVRVVKGFWQEMQAAYWEQVVAVVMRDVVDRK
jgi:hypothetical protein